MDAAFSIRPVEELAETFPDFEVRKLLGHGGMGAVYEAWKKSLERPVALKLLPAELTLSEDFFDRFQREARTMARMDHPNLARVYDSGITDEGEAYIVMELIEGKPITRYADDHQMKLRERLDLFMQVCQGIQHAHQKGVIHRDLKPSNILVAEMEGRPVPKVIDFGLAKPIERPGRDDAIWLSAQHAIGTPAYMSPEQASGEDIDSRSDVYSLGALLYELLTGKPLFDDASLHEATRSAIEKLIRTTPAPLPSGSVSVQGASVSGAGADARSVRASALRGDLDAILLKALHKIPAHRYETVAALAEDIRRHLSHEAVSAVAPTGFYLARKFCSRHHLALAVAGCFVFLLLAGFALIVRESVSAHRAERLAEERLRQGERLIDFMLGDLHGKLQTVGRLDVLEATVGEVERFYAQRTASALSPESLRNRARGLFRLGQIRNAQGKSEAAKNHYDEAIRIYGAAITGRPNVVGWKEELGRTWNSLAVFHHHRGQWESAETAYREALKQSDALLAAEPEHSDWVEFKASLLHNFAALCEANQRLDEAQEKYEEALRLWQPLHARSPDNPKLIENLSHLYLNLAFLQGRRGHMAEVTESNARALQLRERLVRLDPNNVRALALLADIQQNISEVHINEGNLAEAEAWMNRYRPVREQLAARDPENAEWQHFLADAWRNFAVLQNRRNNLEAAADAHRKSWEISEARLGSIEAGGSARLRWIQGLNAADDTFKRLAEREKEQGNFNQARQFYKTLLEIRAKLTNEKLDEPPRRLPLALALLDLAETSLAARDRSSAQQQAYLGLLVFKSCGTIDTSAVGRLDCWARLGEIAGMPVDPNLREPTPDFIRSILAALAGKTTIQQALEHQGVRWPLKLSAELRKVADDNNH